MKRDKIIEQHQSVKDIEAAAEEELKIPWKTYEHVDASGSHVNMEAAKKLGLKKLGRKKLRTELGVFDLTVCRPVASKSDLPDEAALGDQRLVEDEDELYVFSGAEWETYKDYVKWYVSREEPSNPKEFELEVQVYDEIGGKLIARRPGMKDPNPTEEQATCKHEKVFSDLVLCSYPPQYPWICSKCGLEGVDRGTLPQGETYDDVRKKFNK